MTKDSITITITRRQQTTILAGLRLIKMNYDPIYVGAMRRNGDEPLSLEQLKVLYRRINK